MIKLFVFDLDGVLASTGDEHFLAWKDILEPTFQMKIADEVEEKTKGVSRLESLNRILEEYGLEHTISQEEKEDLAFQKNELYKAMISKFDEHNLFPGVIKLLEYLRERGILIALGSASKNGPTLLECTGIKQYFDYVVNPAPLNSKPHPDIFLDAVNHFQLDPSECVGIEDAVSGVSAIKSANMFAIGIGDSDILHEADIVFESIGKIDFDFLDSLVGEKYE